MATTSGWEDTRTFFPLFLGRIERQDVRTVCVVGASDGNRFDGWDGELVRLIDRDTTAAKKE